MNNNKFVDFMKQQSDFLTQINVYTLFNTFENEEEKNYYHSQFFYIRETAQFLTASNTYQYYERHQETLHYCYDKLTEEIKQIPYIDHNSFQQFMLNKFINSGNISLIKKTLNNIDKNVFALVRSMENPLLSLLHNKMTAPVLKEVFNSEWIDIINQLPETPNDSLVNNFIEDFNAGAAILDSRRPDRRKQEALNLKQDGPLYKSQFLLNLYFNALGLLSFDCQKDVEAMQERVDIINFFNNMGLTLSKKQSDELLACAIGTKCFSKTNGQLEKTAIQIFNDFDFYGESGLPIYKSMADCFITFKDDEKPEYNPLADLIFNQNSHILHDMQNNENCDIINLWLVSRVNFVKRIVAENRDTTNPGYIELLFAQTDNLIKMHDHLANKHNLKIMDIEYSRNKIRETLHLKFDLHENLTSESQRKYITRIMDAENTLNNWHNASPVSLAQKNISRL